jgi:hypothetical protein
MSSDPVSLLDSLDSFTASRATQAQAAAKVANAVPSSSAPLDPVEFLNRHYTTESMLISQLPPLRNAVSERMNRLDEKISTALQRQSETAEATRRHVQDAKASVESLERRIRLVQEKASQSERAVLEITKDMKRLDFAKQHLQKTITTLKRLHMLVHAVEQLRLACLLKPFPDYKSASHLVDATRLLLKHFDAYTFKVEPMRLLGKKVTDLQSELRKGLVRGFRVVAFGVPKTLQLEEGVSGTAIAEETKRTSPTSLLPVPGSSLLPTPGVSADSEETQEDAEEEKSIPIMPRDVLADGCLLLDALGSDSRFSFVKNLCADLLEPYTQLFARLRMKPKRKLGPRASRLVLLHQVQRTRIPTVLIKWNDALLGTGDFFAMSTISFLTFFLPTGTFTILSRITFLRRQKCTTSLCSKVLAEMPTARMPRFFSKHYKRLFCLKRK